MSLDRFRQTLTDTLAEVKVRLEADLDATVAAGRLEAEREHTAALAAGEEAMTRVRTEAAATVEALRAELREAQAAVLSQREESDAALARLQAEHAAVTARFDEDHAATTELRKALDGATRARDEYAAEVSRLREHAADADAAVASLRTEAQSAATLYRDTMDTHQGESLRILESVRALDGATTLSEVLDALTIGASRESGRAAMLVVKGDRLIGWRTIGFGGLDHEPRTIDLSGTDLSVLAAAVSTARPAVTGTGSALAPPPFSDAPADRPGLAVPLLVAGRSVAVLYADAGSAAPATRWLSPVEVLVRHASRCLEGLAVQRATATKAAGVRVAASA